MLGGGMVGLASAAIKTQLGPKMNGIVNLELWEPVPPLLFPGIMEFVEKYQTRASLEGVDPLGYFLPPFAYAELQVLGQAISALGTLDEEKLAGYIHNHTFSTIVGDLAFGPDGEWAEARPLWVQYHSITSNELSQFKKPVNSVTILKPDIYQTGELIYPYTKARRQ
jgi:branched-chain amino acid transport system substrate-binding protein